LQALERTIAASDAANLLTAWRDPSDVTHRDRRALQHALSTSVLVADRRWRAAVQGDAAAAIGIALERVPWTFPLPETFDVAMSAVLLAAMDGHLAAEMVLMRARRLARTGRTA
jgi:hypothetical protein